MATKYATTPAVHSIIAAHKSIRALGRTVKTCDYSKRKVKEGGKEKGYTTTRSYTYESRRYFYSFDYLTTKFN